jgi:hypothetical protein
MEIVGEMPFSEWRNLFEAAKKKEMEREAYPLWLVHYAMGLMSGKKIIPFDEMMQGMTGESNPGEGNTASNPEEIKEAALAAVERYENLTKKGEIE